jgi:Tfp pilus assembly protein PilN
MFTIDLLKGQGIPPKSRPEGIAVGAIVFAVPVIVAIVIVGVYMTDNISLSTQKRELADYEKRVDKLSDALELKRAFEKQRATINEVLSEVSSSIDRHMQWSDVLVDIVENMPESMILAELEAKQDMVRRRVAKDGDAETKVDVMVPLRTLSITVSGKSEYDCDRAVRDFSDRLRISKVLGPKLEDIRVSKSNLGRRKQRNFVSYQIDCVFKTPL